MVQALLQNLLRQGEVVIDLKTKWEAGRTKMWVERNIFVEVQRVWRKFCVVGFSIARWFAYLPAELHDEQVNIDRIYCDVVLSCTRAIVQNSGSR